jgi:hypothetical protein
MSMRLRRCNLRILESALTVSFRHAEFQLREAHAVVGMSAAVGHEMLWIGTRASQQERREKPAAPTRAVSTWEPKQCIMAP